MDETMELAANSSGDGKRFQQEIRSLSEQMVVIREQLEIAKERIASNEKRLSRRKFVSLATVFFVSM